MSRRALALTRKGDHQYWRRAFEVESKALSNIWKKRARQPPVNANAQGKRKCRLIAVYQRIGFETDHTAAFFVKKF